MAKRVRRLFRQFQPSHYNLTLDIDPDGMAFTGSVVISGKKVDRPSERLTFHQNGLTITDATICFHDKRGDRNIEVKRINNQNSFDEVRLHTEASLYPGAYTVTMRFRADITRPMNGIYPCFFQHDGQAKKLIATQFESHHAREAFPSIDEPEAKATFDLTLITPSGQTVLANTPVKEQVDAGERTTTSFETTPKMSTYLLAFVCGELAYREATTKDGVAVRAYATPDNAQHTRFAVDTAVKCLEFYNDYFDTPYPLAKCDMVALPDFASGAMENWGLITYREQTLLVDPDNTSLPVKQYVAMVVAHELAHQWFGNLVTMKWWNDLWLNESFASWIEYLATDHLFPEWSMWMQFSVDEQQPALRLDALEHTHPIEVTINHPDEIRTIFDTISYSKGASVLQMLHTYIGANAFRDGLRLYLKQHAYGNTETVDLWNAFEQIAHKPVKKFMAAWTSQAGYPQLHVDVEDTQLTVSQKRFYLNPTAQRDTTATWPIPLDASLQLPVDEVHEPQTIIKLAANGQLLLNKDRGGFYQTTYNPSHMVKLGEAVQAGRLQPVARLGLLSDSFDAAKAGNAQTTDVLQLLEHYSHEDSSVVWDVMAAVVGSTRAVMDDEDLRQAMKPYVRKLVGLQLQRLGWQAAPDEAHFDSLLRPLILGMASHAEEQAVVDEALRRFTAMAKPEDVEPDLRGVIYGTAARTGAAAEYDKLLKLHDESPSSEERLTLTAALTGFKQPELIERTLSMITTDRVRLQDAGYWIAYSFSNRYAKQQTWQWLQANWQWLEDTMGKDLSFYRMPLYAARSFSEASFLEEFQAFFGPMAKLPAFERPIAQAIETIQWQSAWRSRDLAAVKAFFKA